MRRSKIRLPRFTRMLTLCAISMVLSCTPAGPKPGDNVSQSPPHAIHSSDLIRIMDDLQRYSHESWPQELDPNFSSLSNRAREVNLAEARKLSHSLAVAAGSIPDAVKDVDMPNAQREDFLARAKKLEENAVRLYEVSKQENVPLMREVLADIEATCTACHNRFRDIAGPLPGTR